MTGEQAGFRQPGAGREMTGIIGVISDTHGLLRPEALQAMRGCERIIHAGDVGSADVLSQLRDIAPVIAVRGNVDSEAWAMRLPRTATVKIGSHTVYVLHILDDLAIEALTRWHQRSRVRAFPQAVDRGTKRRDLPQPRQRRPAPLPPADLGCEAVRSQRPADGGDHRDRRRRGSVVR